MAFKFAYNIANRTSQPRKHPKATSTAIEKGQVLKKTNVS